MSLFLTYSKKKKKKYRPELTHRIFTLACFRIDDLVLNIDIAPTILDLAGITAPPHMDGRSMLKLLLRRKHHKKHESKWPDTFLVER